MKFGPLLGHRGGILEQKSKFKPPSMGSVLAEFMICRHLKEAVRTSIYLKNLGRNGLE